MRYLRPLTDPATYRGWLWLIGGGALVMPFVLFGEVVVIATAGPGTSGLPQLSPEIFVSVLPLVAVAGAFIPVGQTSVFLARTLLKADGLVDVSAKRTRQRRVRDAAWLTIHLGVGGALSGVTLALTPLLVMIALLPVLSDEALVGPLQGVGGLRVWGPLAVIPTVAGFVYLIAGITACMRRLAERLLGPTVSEKLEASRARTRRLAERNRIARELHDSVGHSLSVVIVQSDAASHVLNTNPAFVEAALASISDSARRALTELDQVLRVLRDDDVVGRGGAVTLTDLPRLLAECGLDVDDHVDEEAFTLPPHLSREAYRIVQESLTNALRHGDGTADLVVTVSADQVTITVTNPIAAKIDHGRAEPERVGFGRAGLEERAAILGGRIDSGENGDRWTVTARFPIPSDE